MLFAIMLIIKVILVVATALIVLRYRRYLAKLHPILAKTYQDLAESNALLAKTQHELNESNASLAKTQQELANTQSELNKINKLISSNKIIITPELNFITPELIESYRSMRVKTKYGGCFMCSGIFVKSDNNLGCSSMVGYYWSLGDITKINMKDFINGPSIQYIRESFKEGYEPFDFCKYCVSRFTSYPEVDPNDPHSNDDQNLVLHIEPTNQCNLQCDKCFYTDERKSLNKPPRVNLKYEAFEKMLFEIAGTRINVKVVKFCGFGEPLFNQKLPEMVKRVRHLYPNCFIYLDTNANFGLKRAEEISNCGFNEIRLALDGVDQITYSTFRKGGKFEKAINFTKKWLNQSKEMKVKPRRSGNMFFLNIMIKMNTS